jgi:hypothetical protein
VLLWLTAAWLHARPQVFGNSPDETAHCRLSLNKESVQEAVVMIQPSLQAFSFPPEGVPLEPEPVRARMRSQIWRSLTKLRISLPQATSTVACGLAAMLCACAVWAAPPGGVSSTLCYVRGVYMIIRCPDSKRVVSACARRRCCSQQAQPWGFA